MCKQKLFLMVSVILFILNGCGNAIQPKEEIQTNKIKAPKVYKTDYDSLLLDIGRMYRVYYSANNPIYFQSKPITNDTGSGGLPVDVSKMVISSISKIGKPVVYVPYDPNYLINELNTGGTINRIMPKYVISGAITEYDKGVMQKSDGGGVDFFVPLSVSGADGSASKDNSITASRIVMDFFLIDYATQTMVSGVHSTKTITIYEESKSKDLGFHIFGSGFGVNGSVSKKQGVHAALRLLVELSIAEILSKEAGLPYWKLSKDLKPDQATIDKVYYDIDGLDNSVKIILMKDYLTKYGFKIKDIENGVVDNQVIAYYNVLRKDLNLGKLENGCISTDDLVKLHFNVPFRKSDKRYKNSMADVINQQSKKMDNTIKSVSPLTNLLSNIDKLSSITSAIYVGSIVDINDMYKTEFSEDLEHKIKEHIKQNQNLTLSLKPIDVKQKTRSFRKRKKITSSDTKQKLVEIVGYVTTTSNGDEVELQVVSKDAQRLRVIREKFTKDNLPKSNYIKTDEHTLDEMRLIARSDSEMKTDDIFFIADKGDTHQIYFDGEKIEFALGVRKPSYAYIFDIDSNLNISTLFDSTLDITTKILKPEELYMIPSADADFEIVAQAPFGKELIKLVVCSVPLDIPNLEKITRSFKKISKKDSVGVSSFIDILRKQAMQKGASIYEKTIIVETRAK